MSRGNRKRCSVCDTDITFATRLTAEDGRMLCTQCANAANAPVGLDELVEFAEPPPPPPGPLTPPLSGTSRRPPAGPSASREGRTARFWIVLASAAGAGLLTAWVCWLFWPTWEDRHGSEVRALLTQAHDAYGRRDIRAAYDTYGRAIALADGHITDQAGILGSQLNAARQHRDTIYPTIAAQIEQEREARVAAEQAAEAERQRQEAVRREAERVAAAERRERERVQKLAAEAATARQAEQRRVDRVRQSEAFAATVREAEEIYRETATDLIGEDSAYRAISRWAKADAKLIAVYARQQGLINSVAVEGSIRATERRYLSATTGEDSAIRAAYLHDQSALDFLGILARTWTPDRSANSSLVTTHSRLVSTTTSRLIGDDSAVRAVSAYNDALLRSWAALTAARGLDPQSIITATDRENDADTSAWRVADRLAAAQVRVLLMLVAIDSPKRAAEIEQTIQIADIGESSALRSLADKKRAIAEALVTLIVRSPK